MSLLVAFLALVYIVRKSKWRVWNPETKLAKLSMLLYEKFEFQNLTYLT